MAGATLLALVVASAAGWLTLLHAALLAAGVMLIARCCTATQARQSVDWQVLIVIGGSFALGKALEVTGAASAAAESLLTLSASPPVLVALSYGAAMGISAAITNNAAAILMFPVVMSVSASTGVDPGAYAMAVMMGASASFSSPIGYQTNLMVMGPGGYRFGDYVRIGLPLDLLLWIASTFIIWKLYL